MTIRTNPATKIATITNSDTVDLTHPCRALYVLTSGNLAVVGHDDTAVTIPVTAGQVIPFEAKRINATGSTGTAAAMW